MSIKQSSKKTDLIAGRRIMQCRYVNPDSAQLSLAENVAMNALKPQEKVEYSAQYQASKTKIHTALQEYIESAHLNSAALLLYQVNCQLKLFGNSPNFTL